MNIRGSPRLTLIYHVTTALLLKFLLLPGVFGSFIISDPELGLPLLLLAVLLIQISTLWWFERNVGTTFNPKDVPQVLEKFERKYTCSIKRPPNCTSMETYVRRGSFFGLSIVVIHLSIILFGASVIDGVWETLLLSCFIASLTTLPLAVLTDCRTETLDRLFFQRKIDQVVERSLVYVVNCTLMGCWTGAIPIPLDWDEPWQRWPITCVIATIGGAVAGHIAHAGKTVMNGRSEWSSTLKGKTLRA